MEHIIQHAYTTLDQWFLFAQIKSQITLDRNQGKNTEKLTSFIATSSLVCTLVPANPHGETQADGGEKGLISRW